MAQETVIIIRPSFKRFCGQDTCRAALFNQFLFWIAWKAKDQSAERVKNGEVSWYGSAEEICAGLDDSWSVNKIRKEIKELVAVGLIGQRHNPANKWDQTRHYFFGIEQGKVLKEMCEKHGICLLHLGLPPNMLHLLNLVNAFDINGKCNCQISEMDSPKTVDPSPKSGNAIPKVTTKVPSKDTNREKETPQFFEIKNQKKRRKEKLPSLIEMDVTKAVNQFREYDKAEETKEAIFQVWKACSGAIEEFDFRTKIASAIEEAQWQPYNKSEYLVKCLIGKCKLSSAIVSVPA